MLGNEYSETHPGNPRLLIVAIFVTGILIANRSFNVLPDYILVNALLIISFGLIKFKNRKSSPLTLSND